MRLCAAVLFGMLVLCPSASAKHSSAGAPPRVSYEAASVTPLQGSFCHEHLCTHPDYAPCPQGLVCVPTLTVSPGGGLFITTRQRVRSVTVTVNSTRLRTYRATARRWAVALPQNLPAGVELGFVVRYRDGAVGKWYIGLNPKQ